MIRDTTRSAGAPGIALDRRKPLPGKVNSRRTARAERRRAERGDGVFRQRVTPAWRHVDLVLPAAVLAISILGVLMVLSSTRGTDPDSYDFSFMRRQAIYVGIGVVLMVLVTTFDYRRLRKVAWLPYVVVVLLLILVMIVGTEVRGSQRWFQFGEFALQPAELAKLSGIIAVAALLASRKTPLRARWVVLSLAVLGLPLAIVLLQPDLGTALVFGAIAVGMLLIAGTHIRHLVILLACAVLAAVMVLTSDFLEDYQRDRLTSFMDQERNTGEQTYNLNESKIAIGSGGSGGKGFLEGTQTRLGNVPEQHTDFIFAALGEELGFVGSATLLVLFWLVCWRVWRTAQIARDRFGMLLCAGVLTMLLFQAFQNIGMTVGLMPITGIPLPFMSYGGSSVVVSWVAIGLVLNVHMRRLR